ncbi:MAG: hypothetical protein PHC34_12480 [Candidatus Gastranaerophilales bacterium]|nr:hypothetical protein [Candidatus Gastranaerophilales bacterium]
MKFTQHQQQIIKHIKSGEIYDLESYLKQFDLCEYIKYDKETILNQFTQDDICKTYHYPCSLTPKAATVITDDEFIQKSNTRQIDCSKYCTLILKLKFDTGIKKVESNGEIHEVNFYDGVYIGKSFDYIIEFLTLWEYLKSELLILEVPAALSANTLGLFFEKSTDTLVLGNSLDNIDFCDSTYKDTPYLVDKLYSFSNEHYTICKEYISKRIYGTPKLNLFIQKGFKTSEEALQKSALIAAWLAILVSIFLTVLPYIYSKYENSPVKTRIINEVTETNDK